jgi:hypothetical protein
MKPRQTGHLDMVTVPIITTNQPCGKSPEAIAVLFAKRDDVYSFKGPRSSFSRNDIPTGSFLTLADELRSRGALPLHQTIQA